MFSWATAMALRGHHTVSDLCMLLLWLQLKLMAKEREIVESQSLESSSRLNHSSSSTSSGPCTLPPAPSGSPATDSSHNFSSSEDLLSPMTEPDYACPPRVGSVPVGIRGLGCRERYLDSPGHPIRPTTKDKHYNSEGESTDVTRSDHAPSSVWDTHASEVYLDATFKELSAIRSGHESRASASHLSVDGPLHSTLLNHTHGYSGASSLYLQDIHHPHLHAQVHAQQPSCASLRVNPVGEEAEYAPAPRGPRVRRPSPPMGERQLCKGHNHPCCPQPQQPVNHNHYAEISQPSMFAYSMAVHQGSAPSTPLPRPEVPSPRKHVTFKSHARIEVFQKSSFEASSTSADKAPPKKDKSKKKSKDKKSLKFFKCCTSANKTYSSLPEKDLPQDVSESKPQIDYVQGGQALYLDDKYEHVYETMVESRPPCVGKEATPLAPPTRARPHSYFSSPCCGNQDCLGPATYSERSVPVDKTADSDASAFMRNRLVRGGITNLGAQFKTLALV